MIARTIQLSGKKSFFLLGPRQTGKSTLIRNRFPEKQSMIFDLLQNQEYLRLVENPSLFRSEILGRPSGCTHIFVDEIQRVPELLNEVHSILESKNPPCFALSGSSARKLKREKANLLAGRALALKLHPLTHLELGARFDLNRALRRGTLPSIYLDENDTEANSVLRTYVHTYLKEEIEQEALVRNLRGFLRFLTLAGNENGNILNYSNIARETGTSYHTVKEYFQLLEDTLVGFILQPYSKSVRQRLVKHPKFYFFDTGVHRALTDKLSLPLEARTSEFGRAFEHFFILEAMRLENYKTMDYRFSFFHSSSHAEVDLIVETPRGEVHAIEIKSTDVPDSSALRGLHSFAALCPKAKLYCACLTPRRRLIGKIEVLPWQEVLSAIGVV